jgi:hypothetical protein
MALQLIEPFLLQTNLHMEHMVSRRSTHRRPFARHRMGLLDSVWGTGMQRGSKSRLGSEGHRQDDGETQHGDGGFESSEEDPFVAGESSQLK